MSICGICGAEEENGNISLEFDRKRDISVSNKDLHYTKCCQWAIAKGRVGCLNKKGQVVDLSLIHI